MTVRARVQSVFRRPRKRVNQLSGSQMRSMLEDKAQRRLGMSADEFIERLDRGDLPDDPVVNELAVLVGHNAS